MIEYFHLFFFTDAKIFTSHETVPRNIFSKILTYLSSIFITINFFEIVSFGLGRRSWRGNGTGTRRGDGEGFRNGYRREVRRSPTRLPFRIGWIRSRTRTRTTIAIWRSRLQSYVIFYVHFSIFFFFLFLFFNHRQAFVAFVRITFQCQ